MSAAFDALSDVQKACLRLVYERHSAKEIGRLTGLTPRTVHYHLSEARRKLGVATSIEAARLYCQTMTGDEVPVAAISPSGQSPSARWLPWPVPTKERPSNDLSPGQRIVAILILAMLFMGIAAIYLVAIGAIDAAI